MRRQGFTLIEMMVVVTIIGAMTLLALSGSDGWQDAEPARASARSVAGAFSYARSEAIRTGRNHMVFIGQDTGGNPLVNEAGDSVPILVLDDGLAGSGNQNCDIDAGEMIRGFRMERSVSFGASVASAKVPVDLGAGAYTSGSTFTDGGGNATTWVLILSDGTPRAATAACAMGALGSGGGGVYVRNGAREIAVVLSPLGAERVYTWQEASSSWK